MFFEDWSEELIFTKTSEVFIAGISKDIFINDLVSSSSLKKYVFSPENHNTELNLKRNLGFQARSDCFSSRDKKYM